MLDLPRLERVHLTENPRGQRIVARGLLAPNYELPPRVRIDIEGKPPNYPVIFAMNHTDRYNYWPFQYKHWRAHNRFTAAWVKGKYYENPAVAKFMELMNNIPTVSRGYLISRDFVSTCERRPSEEEYTALRTAVDAQAFGRSWEESTLRSAVPPAVLDLPRDMLGHPFDPSRESYPQALDALFRTMMRRFVELNQEAFRKNLDLIVFPQGTRSIRLSRGHPGIAQIALAFRKTIVPVGCNGSDKVYPGSSPMARGGHIVYRIGQPITYEDMAPFHIPADFEPFSPEAEKEHGDRFQGLVDRVMDRINELVDPPYRWAEDGASGGVRGSSRFL